MADPFVAEIRIFGFTFPPTGWASCDGQLLPISQNTALFSLLGTYYGGDGKSTFALPNLRDSAAVHAGGNGGGPGLTARSLGEQSGVETVTLLSSEMPLHTHNAMTSGDPSNEQAPEASVHAIGAGVAQYGDVGNLTPLAFQAASPAGGSLPHNNMQPSLVMNFCIAMQGVFPPRP